MLSLTDVAVRRASHLIKCPALALEPGQTLALCGPSGVGKTSLLLAFAGILRPEAGAILIDGQSLWDLNDESRARMRGRSVGYVFASFYLIDALNVLDNLLLACSCAGTPPDRARASVLLTQLGLSGLEKARADRLSQGQQQRVALARALMNRPKVLLADEPTAALDDISAGELIKLLVRSAKDEGAALIIATHDKRVMTAMDRTVMLEAA